MSPVSYLQGQGSLLTAAVLVPLSPPSGLHGLFKEQAVFFFRTRDGVGLVPRSTVSGGDYQKERDAGKCEARRGLSVGKILT